MIRPAPFAFFLLALLLLTLPFRWLLGALFAALVHEIGHLLAIRLLGCEARQIRMGFGGMEMDTCFSGIWQELLCAAAGPAASLGLLLLAPIFPRAALCGFAQGVYNLLPIYPLDGGRIWNCLLRWLIPDKAEKITKRTGQTLIGILLAGALLEAVRRQWGIAALFAWSAGNASGFFGKIPCKTRGKAVQ